MILGSRIPGDVYPKLEPPFSFLITAAGLGVVSLVLDVLLVLFCQDPRFSPRAKNFFIALVIVTFLLFYGGLAFWRLEGWGYNQAIMFCLVTITTVGYGNLVPTDNRSKVIMIFYSLVGLVFLGFALEQFRRLLVEDIIRRIKSRLSRRYRPVVPDEDVDRARKRKKRAAALAIWTTRAVALLGLVIWWLCGALVFMALEGWTFLDSFYFSYVTLSTIGYGDFYPTTSAGMIFLIFFLMFGLGLFAVGLSTLSYARSAQLDAKIKGLTEDEELFAPSSFPRNALIVTEKDSLVAQLMKATSVVGTAVVLAQAVIKERESPLPAVVVLDQERFAELSQSVARCLNKLEHGGEETDLAKWASEYRKKRDLFETTFSMEDR